MSMPFFLSLSSLYRCYLFLLFIRSSRLHLAVCRPIVVTNVKLCVLYFNFSKCTTAILMVSIIIFRAKVSLCYGKSILENTFESIIEQSKQKNVKTNTEKETFKHCCISQIDGVSMKLLVEIKDEPLTN